MPSYFESKKISEMYSGPSQTITAGQSKNQKINLIFRKEDEQHAHELKNGRRQNMVTILKPQQPLNPFIAPSHNFQS